MPPKVHISSKNLIEQEGRILLAISALRIIKFAILLKQLGFIMFPIQLFDDA
jgi:hypothetical protein